MEKKKTNNKKSINNNKLDKKKTTNKTSIKSSTKVDQNKKTTKKTSSNNKVDQNKKITKKKLTKNSNINTKKKNNNKTKSSRKNIKKKTINLKPIHISINIIVLIIIVILSVLLIFKSINNNNKKVDCPKDNIEVTDKIEVTKDVLELEDISNFKNKYHNNNIKGLLYIPDTNIKEVVTQGSDNDYYLNHDLYNNYDIRGTVFLDYRVNIKTDRKALIYSHNSENIEVPFRELEGYYDESYYHNHKYIYYKTLDGISKYEVFSVYVETSDWDYMNTDFNDDTEWFNHIKKLKNKSWYDTNIEINKNDKILILQTCSELKKYKKYNQKYLLIISKKIV